MADNSLTDQELTARIIRAVVKGFELGGYEVVKFDPTTREEGPLVILARFTPKDFE